MKILFNAIIGKARSIAVAALTGLGGWQLWLANLASKYLLKYAVAGAKAAGKLIGSAIAYFKLDQINEEQKKKEEKYEETLKDGVTEQDQDDATSDLLNRRKH